MVLGLLAAVLLLAACSSGDGASESDDSDDDAFEGDTIVESTEDTEDSQDNGDSEETAVTVVPLGAQPVPGGLSESEKLDSYEVADVDTGTMVTVTNDGVTRTIESNSLPDHETGEFPNDGNPNTISAQERTWEFPVEPVFTGDATPARVPAVAVNGVKFEPGTAESVDCATGESYRVEAQQDAFDLGLDMNEAHVQPTGEYHYHGVSDLLVEAYATDDDLVHVGFAADGFLVYYSKAGNYQPAYLPGDIGRVGLDCTLSIPGSETFDLTGSFADGTYESDWEFLQVIGDLDECNGLNIDGQYAYIMTDAYPFLPRCLKGEFTERGPGG